jgi:hypothetical protein
MKKSVNGELVDMTPAEEAALLAEWESNANKVVVPQSVPMRKAKQYLNQIDKYEAVDAYFASLTGRAGREAQIFWCDSQYVERYRQLTLDMFTMLGVNTDAERDQWFIKANNLE